MHFDASDSFRAQVDELLPQVQSLVRTVAARADVQEMGSTAVPGVLTKGDLDINVRLQNREEFDRVVTFLAGHFAIHQPQNWIDGYASFADEHSYALPVGIQVTILGHPEDKFIGQRDRLAANPELVAKYNALKMSFEGRDANDYRASKWEFIETYLSGGSA
jgi:uncharacterized protein